MPRWSESNSSIRSRRRVREVVARYPNAAHVVWVQEEPRNMGAWAFVRGQIQPLLEVQNRRIGYAGRPRVRVQRRDR
jgi:2-oxoglutarate dehydrogenase E1 component